MTGALGARAPSAVLSATIVVPPISNGQRQFIERAQNQEHRRRVRLFGERFKNAIVLIAIVLRIHESAPSARNERTKTRRHIPIPLQKLA